MPPNRKVWSAWNSFVDPDADLGSVHRTSSTTFDLNLLHNLDVGIHGHIFGSINPPVAVDESKVVTRLQYTQPVLNPLTLDTGRSQALKPIDPLRKLSFAGAWLGLGTHEDGWNSGVAAAQALGAVLPWGKFPRSPVVPPIGWIEAINRVLFIDIGARFWTVVASWLLVIM